MMLPVSRFESQPVGMVTTTAPWLPFSSDPAPPWLWLATPPLVFYPPAVWIPEHTRLIQWERPAVEVVPVVPSFYCSSPLHPPLPPLPLPKLAEGWIPPEEVGVFQRRDKPALLTNHVTQWPDRLAHRKRLLPSPPLSGRVKKDATKTKGCEHTCLPLHLLSVSQLHLPLLTAPPPAGGAHWEWAGLHVQRDEGVWPIVINNQWQRGAWSRPTICLKRTPSRPTQQLCSDPWPFLPVQVLKEVLPHFFSSRFSSGFTLLTNYRHRKRGMSGGGGALLLRTERKTDDSEKKCVGVSAHREEEEEVKNRSEGGRKDRRPVASTPVPGSPWCVVWTGDDQIFFFNPTMHLSVWERPGELIGRDISRIIEDPPHKRKKMADSSSSGHSPGLHGNNEDGDDHEHASKRNRREESLSPGEVKLLLPVDLRVARFREMMLERGVSAFSSWEKELHKMVFDPRYLLLSPEQRKQVFDQFVKERLNVEFKEKKTKLQKAREEFRRLLQQEAVSSRTTFKEFCARYHGDHRFDALNRKKEQEVLFHHYITSLKKRAKENRARLRKMR